MIRRPAPAVSLFAVLALTGALAPAAFAFTWLLPAGGETWTAGTTHKVEWSGGPAANVNVSVIRLVPFQVAGSIAANVPNAGYETWAIPPTLTPGSYQLYVEDTAVSEYTYGPTFTIQAAPQCGEDCTLVAYSVSNYGYPSGMCDTTPGGALTAAQNYVLSNLSSACPGGSAIDPSSIVVDATILPFGVCFVGYSGQYIAEASAVACCCPQATPSEASTWGGVKATYR